MADNYITIRQVAKLIGVTPLTLRNWDRRGLLVAYRNPINNYRLYRYADVMDFLAEIKRSGPLRGEEQKLPVTLMEDTDSAAEALTSAPDDLLPPAV